MELSLDELAAKVKQQSETFRQKQRHRYYLAKELGFSAAEAVILQNHNEKTIRRLAEHKANARH